jgi:hypothetical protein
MPRLSTVTPQGPPPRLKQADRRPTPLPAARKDTGSSPSALPSALPSVHTTGNEATALCPREQNGCCLGAERPSPTDRDFRDDTVYGHCTALWPFLPAIFIGAVCARHFPPRESQRLLAPHEVFLSICGIRVSKVATVSRCCPTRFTRALQSRPLRLPRQHSSVGAPLIGLLSFRALCRHARSLGRVEMYGLNQKSGTLSRWLPCCH